MSVTGMGESHESIVTVVGNPLPGAVHDVGLRRNALSGAPDWQLGPVLNGAGCPGQARSGSCTGSAGTPHSVSVVPVIAIPSGTFVALTVTP